MLNFIPAILDIQSHLKKSIILLFGCFFFLSTMAQLPLPNASTKVTKVSLVIIDPPVASYGGQRLHEIFNWNDPFELAQTYLDSLNAVSHGVVDYQIVETIDDGQIFTYFTGGQSLTLDSVVTLFEEPAWATLKSFEMTGDVRFNYNDLIDAYDFCTKRDAETIHEVWVWAFPIAGMWESTLAGQNAFWLNSQPQQNTTCQDLLTIMGLNYERQLAEALHSYGHRAESVMRHLYGRWNYNANPLNSWEKFSSYDLVKPGEAHIGNIHFPPNGIQDYDYTNPATVTTFADNWDTYPNLGNTSRQITCAEWNCSHEGYMLWWYRHMPHFEGLDGDNFLNNWWHYFVDYNDAVARAEALAMNTEIDLQLSLTPSDPTPDQYDIVTFTATLTNVGTSTATGVKVHFPKPTEVVYQGSTAFTASQGTFLPFSNQQWDVGSIPTGGSATLEVNYFLLNTDPVTTFTQVIAANENDVDSTPNNGACCSTNEDDEAVSGINGGGLNLPDLLISQIIFPSPAEQLEDIPIEITVQNIGNAPAIGSANIQLCFSNAPNSCDGQLGVFNPMSLDIPAGGSQVFNIINQIPALPPGDYFLYLEIDVFQLIEESDELNNGGWQPLVIIEPGSVCTGDVVLTTQAEVDAFSGCSIIDGDLIINGDASDITNLNALQTVIEITGALVIQNANMLPNLQGLHNLANVGGALVFNNNSLLTNVNELSNMVRPTSTTVLFTSNQELLNLDGLTGVTNASPLIISDNTKLKNLNGLSNLQQINSNFDLIGNDALENIDGLLNITEIPTFFIVVDNPSLPNLNGLNQLTSVGELFVIDNCDGLNDLSPLSNLTSVKDLVFLNNDGLTSLNGLQNLQTVTGIFRISENSILSDCCTIKNLLESGNITGAITIENNPSFCSSTAEIIANCDDDIDLALMMGASPSSPLPFSNFTVTAILTNNSSNEATGVVLHFPKPNEVVYQGANPFDASQGTFEPYGNKKWVVGTLAPGASATLDINYFLLQSGVIDFYGQVVAADQNDSNSTPNNGTCCTPNENDEAVFTILPPSLMPDLTLTDLNAPTNGSTGDIVSYSFDLNNIGNAPAQGNFTIGAFLSTDNLLDASDALVGIVTTGNITPGTQNDVPGAITIPNSFASGSYFLILKADIEDSIPEFNENNNTTSAPFQVTGGALVCMDDYFLTTQAEVDAFPGCEILEGNLQIGGTDITNLNALGTLIKITGTCAVTDCNNLPNLQGLHNLVSVEGPLVLFENALIEHVDEWSGIVRNTVQPLVLAHNPELRQIDGVHGVTRASYIEVADNAKLENMDGLSSFEILEGDAFLTENPSLQNINGLSNITHIQGALQLHNCPSLTNLNGLSNLEIVDGGFGLTGETNLLTINGLQNLEFVGGFIIAENPLLQNLDPLSALMHVQNQLIIVDNPQLSDCCGIFDLLDSGFIGGTTTIENNPAFCNSAAEILANCMSNNGMVDLELSLTATPNNPKIYTNFTITATLTNNGSQEATGIKVHLPKPADVVYKGGNPFNTSTGTFVPFGNQEWNIASLAVGASVTIDLNYFLLTTNPVESYGQVIAANEVDDDSTPNNGTCCTANEDDEAAITVVPNAFPPGSSSPFSMQIFESNALTITKVFPNPVQSALNLTLWNGIGESVQIVIVDTFGKQLQKSDFDGITGWQNIEMNVQTLSPGIYFVKARSGEWEEVHRIVKATK